MAARLSSSSKDVQQIHVLQKEESGCLIVRIERNKVSEFVESLLIHEFRMFYEAH